MMMWSLIGTVAAYVLLAALLLSLNIASLWRWWIKAGAIVLTAMEFVGAYVAISGLVGWPSDSAMPARFNLLSTRIVEPDSLRHTPGQIYLWVEEIDDNQIVISPPRAYAVAYEVELASETAGAQEQLNGGQKIMGKSSAEENGEAGENQTPSEEDAGQTATMAGAQLKGRTKGAAGSVTNFATRPSVSFSDMPPVSLPAKSGETP